MKVSKLIEEIVTAAELQFGVSGHYNDCYEVSITFAPQVNLWQASLIRPTQRQLDSGEVDLCATTKQYEYLTSFYTSGPTLVEVLVDLKNKVDVACDWEDGHQ